MYTLSTARSNAARVHASRSYECELCGRTVYGNGGKVAHGRGHVRRGEAVELVRDTEYDATPSRIFLAPDSEHIAELLNNGLLSYVVVEP